MLLSPCVQEARRRNPKILTYALSWGVPGWVGNGTYYSSQDIDYHIDFMNCARDVYGVTMDYMGKSALSSKINNGYDMIVHTASHET